MSDFKQIFSDEIRRLSRKEIKLAMEPMAKTLAAQRLTIAVLRKQVKALEKIVGIAAPAAVQAAAEPAGGKKIARRITGKRIMAMRNKLKLSQIQFAALLDVSLSSIVNWEGDKSVPQAAQKERIAALRGIGKREIAKRIQAAGLELKPKRGPKPAAKPAAKSAAKPAAKSAAKTVAKPAAKTAAKTAAKPAAKTAAKTVVKPAAKTAAKTAAKPAAKSAVKPAVKTAEKPASPAAVPAPQAPETKK